ncbi:hypothetical protein, partial [Novosphingobium album (ex Hu et al. 2023)]
AATEAATTAAEAATIATAEAATTAATEAAAITAAETATIAAAEATAITAAETILPTEKRIEIVLSEPIPLVASPSATTSVKTHLYERTLRCAQKARARTRGRDRAGRQGKNEQSSPLSCNHASYTTPNAIANGNTGQFEPECPFSFDFDQQFGLRVRQSRS